MSIFEQIDKAYNDGKLYVVLKDLQSEINAVSKWNKQNGKSARSFAYRGKRIVVFLKNIIKHGSK